MSQFSSEAEVGKGASGKTGTVAIPRPFFLSQPIAFLARLV
jgi:hypothetical protein